MWSTIAETVESLIEVYGKEQLKILKNRNAIIEFIKSNYLKNGENHELLADCKFTDTDKASEIIFKTFQKTFKE